MPRFLSQFKEIRNKNIVFSVEQSKKIRKVLRLKVGDKVIVFDNQGWEYLVEITKLRVEGCVGRILEQKLHTRESNLVLYQALPKNLKVEFIIQKCTELGVDQIVFFESEHSQVKAELMNDKKLKRWQKIGDSSAEQCGRIFTPIISLEKEKRLGDLLNSNDLVPNNSLVLDIDGQYLNKFENINTKQVNIFVGPEGGFSQKEKDLFEEKNIRKLKLSENILRSETAGMVFFAQWSLLK